MNLLILIFIASLVQSIDSTFTVCSSINIQGKITIQKLAKIRNCSIVLGHIRILNTKFLDLNETFSIFPNLVEITDYLLIFQAQNLNNLNTLFPKLSIIRGHNLFKNKALIIFLTNSLRKINLKSLVRIDRGSILISRLYHACYIDTVDWAYILKNSTKPSISLNNNECLNSCKTNCWSEKYPQLKCPNNCDHNCNLENTTECCQDPLCSYCTQNSCLSCSKYRDISTKTGQCVSECPKNSLIYENSLCIRPEDCSLKPNSLVKDYNLLDDLKCVKECPVGYRLNFTIKNLNNEKIRFRECIKCHDAVCKKDCSEIQFHINKKTDMERIRNCYKVKSLILELNDDSNVLLEYFQYLEEIQDYLILTRNKHISSLNFFQRLKTIHGNNLFENKYSLFVHTNPKLRDLWPSLDKKEFKILNGTIKFFENPQLCYQNIVNLIVHSNLSSVHESDVSFSFNGYRRLTCSNRTIDLSFEPKKSSVVVSWNVTISDTRRLKGFFVNYIQANNLVQDVNFDQSDWMNVYVEFKQNQGTKISVSLENLDAFTRYAVNVKADLFVNSNWIVNGQDKIISKIVYVQTLPSQPGKIDNVFHESTSFDQAILKWKPPRKPNGFIEFYFIAYAELSDPETFSIGIDNCDLEPSSIIPKYETKGIEANEVHDKTDKCETTRSKMEQIKMDQNDSEQDDIISIEDEIYNLAFKPSRTFAESTKKIMIKNVTSTYIPSTSTRKIIDQQQSDPMVENNFDPETKLLKLVRKDLYFQENESSFVTIRTSNNTLTANFTGLKSFQRYIVSILACQNYTQDLKKYVKENKNVDFFSLESYCSKSSVYTFRSLPDERLDYIPEAYLYTEKNVFYFKWSKPERPNGIIFKYNLKFIDSKSNKTYGPICHSSLESLIVPLNQFLLTEGRLYLVSVQAVSTSGYGPWSTQTVKYKVPSLSEYYLILTIQITAILFTIFITFFGIFIIFKKFHQSKEKGYFSIKSHYYYFRPDEWEVKRENLKVNERIGSGCFSEVHKGQLLDVRTNEYVDCAIKFCGSDHQSRQRLLKEANMMKSINTTHIVKLLGVISRENPAYLILEYMDNGDLKEYLKNFRSNENGISSERFYRIAAEIADGMLWLSEHKYIHRDLAARNCLISKDNVIKIADLGLSKDIYQNPIYREKCKELLPIRWMSPESLLDGSSTTKSDVWSYGVVIWEMVTYGDNPYSGKENEDVIQFVKNGGRLELPESAPFKFITIFSKCMIKEDFKRISFKEILDVLDPDLMNDFKLTSYFHNDFRKKSTKRKVSSVEEKKVEVIISEPCAGDLDNYM